MELFSVVNKTSLVAPCVISPSRKQTFFSSKLGSLTVSLKLTAGKSRTERLASLRSLRAKFVRGVGVGVGISVGANPVVVFPSSKTASRRGAGRATTRTWLGLLFRL